MLRSKPENVEPHSRQIYFTRASYYFSYFFIYIFSMRTYKHSICTLISLHKKQKFWHVKLLITYFSRKLTKINENFVNYTLSVDKNNFINQHAFTSKFCRRTGEKIPASKFINYFSRFMSWRHSNFSMLIVFLSLWNSLFMCTI